MIDLNIEDFLKNVEDSKKEKDTKVTFSITHKRKQSILDKFGSIEEFERKVDELYEAIMNKKGGK